jgi:peptide/nickel transport system ATP-binding protein
MNVATRLSGSHATAVVRVRDLAVRFARDGAEIIAVNGVSFSLARGEVLTVIGESGSGKSVLLRTLLGLRPAYARVDGEVEVDGRNLARLSSAELARLRGGVISLVFQEPATALDPVFTIGDQIAETIVRHERISRQRATSRARELFDMVAIPSAARRLKQYPHEMSGGMRQRAMIAMALSCRPKVLLADEPTTALDATVQIQLLLLLRNLQRELDMSVIFVTHDIGVAAEISDRVAVMYAGRFVETGPVETVLISPRHPYTRGLLACTVHGSMRGQPLRTIRGSPPDMRRLPLGCAFAPRCGLAEPECSAVLPVMTCINEGHEVACHVTSRRP